MSFFPLFHFRVNATSFFFLRHFYNYHRGDVEINLLSASTFIYIYLFGFLYHIFFKLFIPFFILSYFYPSFSPRFFYLSLFRLFQLSRLWSLPIFLFPYFPFTSFVSFFTSFHHSFLLSPSLAQAFFFPFSIFLTNLRTYQLASTFSFSLPFLPLTFYHNTESFKILQTSHIAYPSLPFPFPSLPFPSFSSYPLLCSFLLSSLFFPSHSIPHECR